MSCIKTRAPEFEILDEKIAAGWGDIAQMLIPHDWRDRRGPDYEELQAIQPGARGAMSAERKAAIGEGVKRKRWGFGSRGQRVRK